MKRMLDLFAGSKSVSRIFEAAIEILGRLYGCRFEKGEQMIDRERGR